MVEDDIRLVLDKYNSGYFTYELEPGTYTFKDLSKALFNIFKLESLASSCEIVIEFDDITRKTKLVVRPEIIAIRFDEKSFSCNVLGFTSGWDYKHYNEYVNQRIVNLSTTNKIHLKCDVIDGIVVNGLGRPISYSFLFQEPVGFEVLSQPETSHYKKNKIVLNTITFYLEDNNNEEVDFNRETLNFTLQMIKI